MYLKKQIVELSKNRKRMYNHEHHGTLQKQRDFTTTENVVPSVSKEREHERDAE